MSASSSCPPLRELAIGPKNRPPLSTIGAHWGLTQGGAKAGMPLAGRQKQFHGWAAECEQHKRFYLPEKMPPDFLEGAGEDLSYASLGGSPSRK